MAAVLENATDRVARLVERGEALEQTVVAQLERQGKVAEHAAGAFPRRDEADLGGAGLAGEENARHLHARAAGGAIAIDHRVHRIVDDCQMLSRCTERFAFDLLAGEQARD